MRGSTALIISSTHGIVWDIIGRFAQQGCNIALSGSAKSTNFTRKMIPTLQDEHSSGETVYLENYCGSENLVEQTLDRFQSIDYLLINNIDQHPYRAAIEEFPIEKWREIIEYQLISRFALVKAIWLQMKQQHFGRIIQIANEDSWVGGEYKSACTAAHHAMLGLNTAMSIEGAPFGITSNIICAGYRQTHLAEQFSHVRSLPELIQFLCADHARQITGQTIGWTLD